MDIVTVYVTTKDEAEAERIGRALLNAKLVACVTIVPRVRSLYEWQGSIADEHEALLLAKAPAGRQDEIVAVVKAHHSYAVPCINFLSTVAGNEDYATWLASATKPKNSF